MIEGSDAIDAGPSVTAIMNHTFNVNTHKPEPPKFRPQTFVGFIYIAMSIGLGLRHVSLVQHGAQNDYYWIDFNTTGIQTYLCDLYNFQISLHDDTIQSLEFDSSLSFVKNYSTATTKIDQNPTRARNVLLSNHPIEKIISTLRLNNENENDQWHGIAMCWVDFKKRFMLAHTLKRQNRCINQDITNGAVYLESYLRNSNFNSGHYYYNALNNSVYNALRISREGNEWLEYIENHIFISNEKEIEFWYENNITRWQIQLRNDFQHGIEEKITIQNALGWNNSFTIQHDPYKKTINRWTTKYAYRGFWNDVETCGYILNCSLVRGAWNHYNEWNSYIINSRRSSSIDLIGTYLGPFGTIDIHYISPSYILTKQIKLFRKILYHTLEENNTLAKLYMNSIPIILKPIPNSWQNYNSFYGGNPFCFYSTSKKYIQTSFDINDDCTIQKEYSIEINRENGIYGLFMYSSSNITTICYLSKMTFQECEVTLNSLKSIYMDIIGLHSINRTIINNYIQELNIKMLQFTKYNLLQHHIITSDPWSYYGWISIYDWTIGKREIYCFNGDRNNITLITPLQKDEKINEFYIPQYTSYYLNCIVIYVTFILTLVAIVMLFYGMFIQFQAEGGHLFQFNRIVGSVWIGRPLIFLRGCSAGILLSSCNIILNQRYGISRIEIDIRSIYSIFVLAGEISWISYVILDILLPFSNLNIKKYTPYFSFLTWILTILFNRIYPIIPQSFIYSNCILLSENISKCESGYFIIGNIYHFGILLLIQIITTFLLFLLSFLRSYLSLYSRPMESHLLVPMISQIFYGNGDQGVLAMDKVACIMTGMISYKSYIFDLKLWEIIPMKKIRSKVAFVFQHPQLHRSKSNLLDDKKIPISNKRIQLNSIFGIFYLLFTIFCSFYYLYLIDSNIQNDFWLNTLNFNQSQLFLSRWFTRYLQYTNNININIDQIKYGDFKTNNILTYSKFYSTSIQDQVNALTQVIPALRRMNTCEFLWISTAFCYLDFKHQWEMAYSQRRQNRCLDIQENGAIYMESYLRNIERNDLCFEKLFEIIFKDIKNLNDGKKWISSILSNQILIEDEINYWKLNKINFFQTQWQNYKEIGIFERYDIKNALGMSYPMVLKDSHGSFQLNSQTSMKFNWIFKNIYDLIELNSSFLNEISFIRQNKLFLYENQTILNLLNNIILNPMDSYHLNVYNLFGPFGTIDLYRIPSPFLLCELNRLLDELLIEYFSNENNFILKNQYYIPIPNEWKNYSLHGNIFDIMNGINSLELYTTSFNQYKSYLILSQNNTPSISSICEYVENSMECMMILNSFQIINKEINFSSIELIKNIILNDLNIQHSQFIQYNNFSIELEFYSIFKNNNSMDYFSWLYLFDWVYGGREVIQIHGDSNKKTIFSSSHLYHTYSMNLNSIPKNISYTIQYLLKYISILLFIIILISIFYTIQSNGFIEYKNFIHFNRITTLIYIGRPLIIMRSIIAMVILSTTTLELISLNNNEILFFNSPSPSWLLTLFTSSETSWFLYVIHDIFSPYTRKLTLNYSFKSTILYFLSIFLYTMTRPILNDIELNRNCFIDIIDYQSTCTSGIFYIGSFNRIIIFLGLAFSISFFCYVFDYFNSLEPKCKNPYETISLFLHGLAKHYYELNTWKYHGIRYIDRSSALFNGLITIIYKKRIYLFDIKTWRFYILDYTNEQNALNVPKSIAKAIPLLE